MRISDWSSDVCSSDLVAPLRQAREERDIGGKTIGEIQRSLAAEEARRLFLQRFMLGRIAAQQARTTGAHGHPAPDRVRHRARNRLVIRQPQIIIRGEIPALTRDQSRSEEHTSELQSLMRISYAVFCLKKKQHI